jgi:hypothetical protein
MNRRPGRHGLVYLIGVVVVIAGGYLSFELGRYRAGYSMMDHRRSVAVVRQQLDAERAASDELRRQLAIAETSKEIDRETYSQVEANLADLQAQIQAQEEELVFYRGIVSPQDGVPGLRIQSLDALRADAENHYSLRLVLVQAIVHSRKVAGVVKLRLEGTRDGQAVSFDAAEILAEGGEYDMEYEFRYFQGLECELALPVGFEPARVNVEIWPNDARANKVNQSYEWSAITD